eukprot:5692645-Heterocapsa_arctica.AAC.2
MTDSKVDKESETEDIKHKTAKQQDESQALTEEGGPRGQAEEGQDRAHVPLPVRVRRRRLPET